MATLAPPRLLTAEEFYKLPDPKHGGKMELVRGEVVVHMPVGGPHGNLAAEVSGELRSFNRLHRLGSVGLEVGFRVARNPDTVLAPDVHFVRAARLPDGRHMPPSFFDGYPDLAVEIVSPDDTAKEVADKVAAYLAARAPRVWVVRPEGQTVTVHTQGGDVRTLGLGDLLTSDDAGFEVDGFELSLDELFA